MRTIIDRGFRGAGALESLIALSLTLAAITGLAPRTAEQHVAGVPDGTIRHDDARGAMHEPVVDGRRAQASPIETEAAAAYFEEARRLSGEDGGSLWGVELYGPLLFVDAPTRTVVGNMPDSAGYLSEVGDVYLGRLPSDQSPANTAVDWSGRRWTMLLWPLPSYRYDRRRLLAHEFFHRIQPQIGIPMRDPPNAHLATTDGRIWLRLEWRALAEALIRQGDERRKALADALAFRKRRHTLFPEAAAEERALELNEGLAEYTGLRLSGLPDRVLADRAAVALEARERQASLTRSFAYASGPAYGILLDDRSEGWRTGLTPESDLAILAARAYGIRESSPPDADARATRYDGDRVVADETARAERRAAELARLRARFIEGPVLNLEPGSAFRYSFDPTAAVTIPGVGTVYDAAHVTSDWGALNVESGGVLFTRTDSGITGVVVPVSQGSPEPPTEGDGWRLEVAEGWSVEPGTRAGDWRVMKSGG